MRDPAEIFTKTGKPMILVVSRVAFAAYFLFFLWTLRAGKFPYSNLHFVWLLYVFCIYLLAEKLYSFFKKKDIDLTFAFPILFAIYLLNFASLFLGGQERLPLLNRTEHYASFVLIGYILWVFFIKYLPQRVWIEHPYYTALVVLAFTALAGVGNELAELLMDHLFATEYVGKKLDTSLDLLMNTLGSGTFLAVRLILGTREGTPKQ